MEDNGEWPDPAVALNSFYEAEDATAEGTEKETETASAEAANTEADKETEEESAHFSFTIKNGLPYDVIVKLADGDVMAVDSICVTGSAVSEIEYMEATGEEPALTLEKNGEDADPYSIMDTEILGNGHYFISMDGDLEECGYVLTISPNEG